jgi:hypothetical protein
MRRTWLVAVFVLAVACGPGDGDGDSSLDDDSGSPSCERGRPASADIDCAAGWEGVGDPAFDAGDNVISGGTVVTVDQNGAPVIVVPVEQSDDESLSLQVRRFDGGSWQTVGSAISVGAAPIGGYTPVFAGVATGPDGGLAVAHLRDTADGETTQEVVVSEWTGDAWESTSPLTVSEQTSLMSATLEYRADGTPVLGVLTGSKGSVSSTEFSVRQWDGGAWSTLGEPLSADNVQDHASVRLRRGPSGTLHTMWVEQRAEKVVAKLAAWNSGSWEAVGEPILTEASDDPFFLSSGHLAFDSSGAPHALVVVEKPEGEKSEGGVESAFGYVYKWTGDSWQAKARDPCIRKQKTSDPPTAEKLGVPSLKVSGLGGNEVVLDFFVDSRDAPMVASGELGPSTVSRYAPEGRYYMLENPDEAGFGGDWRDGNDYGSSPNQTSSHDAALGPDGALYGIWTTDGGKAYVPRYQLAAPK